MQPANETVLGNYEHLMLEHAPVGIALFEAQTLRLLSANPPYQSLFEPTWQLGQAIGQCLRDLLPKTVQAEVVALFDHVIQTGVASESQAYRTFSPTGGVRYWNWTLSPLEEEGQVRFVLVTITEVTTTVLAHQETERVQTMLRQTHHAVERERRHLADLETILLGLKQVAEPKRLAQTLLEALESCFSPLVAALYGITDEPGNFSLLAVRAPINLPVATSLLSATLSSQQHPDALHALQHPIPLIRRKSESQNPAQEPWWSVPETRCVLSLPLWGKRCEGLLLLALRTEEEADELLHTLRDCAPRLAEALASAHLHAALADEKHRLHTILDQLPEGVLLVEARTSRISYANPAAAHLLGFALPQLVGTPLNQSALLSPYGRPKQVQQSIFRWNFALIDALWGKHSTSQELSISRPDGSEVVVLSSAAPIRQYHGLISEAAIVFQDITALKHLEQQKDAFFAVANHELRTPLTIISGFVDLLQIQDTQQATVLSAHALESIQQECGHLLRLFQDLLDVSRLDQARLAVQPQVQDLLAPLKQSITKQIQTTRTHQFRFLLEDWQSSDQLLGCFDLPRIEQVVRNLISNAVKYSPTGSTIEVGMRLRRDPEGIAQEVVLWVKDQGIGIPTGDLPHIFERFYRASNSHRSASGFGIGLYLTRQLVQAHEGRIWAETMVGKGTTFFVVLPLGESTIKPV